MTSKKIFLPKKIRDDQKLKEKFGEDEVVKEMWGPVEPEKPEVKQLIKSEPEKVLTEHRKYMGRHFFVEKEIRICIECGKEYQPEQKTQKRCFECNLKRRKEQGKTTHCIECGRWSTCLIEGKCSFCRKTNARIRTEIKEAQTEKNARMGESMGKFNYYQPTKKCARCGAGISDNEYKTFKGLCPSCAVLLKR